MNDDVERLLANQQPDIAEISRAACGLALAVYPDAVVTVDGQDVGFGRGTGYKGLIFVVTPHRAHVTLGVAHGAGLPDPAGLLEGAGKVHRHVKLRTVDDVARPDLRDLMVAAALRSLGR